LLLLLSLPPLLPVFLLSFRSAEEESAVVFVRTCFHSSNRTGYCLFTEKTSHFRKFPCKNACQAPNSPKPAPIKGISIAHQFHPIR
jgi:hypothetical protein